MAQEITGEAVEARTRNSVGTASPRGGPFVADHVFCAAQQLTLKVAKGKTGDITDEVTVRFTGG